MYHFFVEGFLGYRIVVILSDKRKLISYFSDREVEIITSTFLILQYKSEQIWKNWAAFANLLQIDIYILYRQ